MFLFFWTGQKTDKEKIGTGTFHCPVCGKQEPYVRYRLTTRLTLYSVLPVGKKQEAGQVLQCSKCHNQFPPSIEKGGRSAGRGSVWVCSECGNVNPWEAPACLKCGHPS